MSQKRSRKRTLSQKQIEQKVNRVLPSLAGVAPDPAWTPLERAVDKNGSHTFSDGENVFRVFINSRYTVMRRTFKPDADGPAIVHLSIRRNDRKPIVNWRDMQQIKNEMVGAECEGVQLFPAESRLVDNANQYHIYVCSDPEFRMPFGYNERLVSESGMGGAVQEPFEPHVRPDDMISEEELRKAFDAFSAQRVPLDGCQEHE